MWCRWKKRIIKIPRPRYIDIGFAARLLDSDAHNQLIFSLNFEVGIYFLEPRLKIFFSNLRRKLQTVETRRDHLYTWQASRFTVTLNDKTTFEANLLLGFVPTFTLKSSTNGQFSLLCNFLTLKLARKHVNNSVLYRPRDLYVSFHRNK